MARAGWLALALGFVPLALFAQDAPPGNEGPVLRVALAPDAAEQLRADGVQGEHQQAAMEAVARRAQADPDPFTLQAVVRWIVLHGFNLLLIVAGAYGLHSLFGFFGQRFVRTMTRAGEGETEEDRAIRAEVLVSYLRPVITTGVVIVAGLMILDELSVPVAPLVALASASIALIGVGFIAVWSVLSNALCSVILLIYQPFSVGNIVELTTAEVSGKVVNFNMLFTTLRTDNGDLIEVPNNLFFQQPILRRLGTAETTLDKQLLEQDTKD